MLYTLHPRESVIENVNKMMHCGDSSYGGAMYHCPDCNEWNFVPFRCHSRFCPTCGNMYSIDRTTSMSFKLLSCTHRHCVFTIPEQLRHFFLEDRSLLNCLFSSVRSVILCMFHKMNAHTVVKQWCFLKFITIIAPSPCKIYMRKPWKSIGFVLLPVVNFFYLRPLRDTIKLSCVRNGGFTFEKNYD